MTPPITPDVGVNELTVGVSTTVKLAVVVVVPDGVVTAILPVVAPAGMVAVIVSSSGCVNSAILPLIVTVAPITSWSGVNESIRGSTLKIAALGLLVPASSWTVNLSLVAPSG